ncbi:Rrf2 family transcriptional regulator [Paenibacillus cineris]|uniref:Rrf2 family transcriptional regulator n=1 Tax=Paenibacillus cineris TaxID=237530 RepID=UPI001B0CB57A|nr:hypothetical protein J43TS9_15190 [Paenibacillus cineris]
MYSQRKTYNTPFTVAVHILACSAIAGSQATSDFIATSVNTNPVVVRRINTLLKKAGLITTQIGVGSVNLIHDPEDITLLDIYKAVTSLDNRLFEVHNTLIRNAQWAVIKGLTLQDI